MKNQLKIFEFTDSLFCYTCVVVAYTLEEAIEFAESAGVSNCANKSWWEEREIKSGLVIQGGGNG